MSLGPVLVLAPLEEPRLHDAVEPSREHVAAHPQAVLELVETGEPVAGIAHDQRSPAVAGDREGAGH